MNVTFNLAVEPWIPCIDLTGRVQLLNLPDALCRAHELREISGDSPPVTVAIHRLLLAVLHRAYNGPGSAAEWSNAWEEGRWDEACVRRYVEQWQERFDLFHPTRPFYQGPMDGVATNSVKVLIHDAASGHNGTLFNHHLDSQDITVPAAQAARNLLTTQSAGLSGTSSVDENFTAGPCASGVLFLVQGSNLFETLSLNWLRYKNDDPLPRLGEDKPAWEQDDPFDPAPRLPRGYLDYLTWHNRRVQLIPEVVDGELVVRRVKVVPGLRMDPGIRDPMKHYNVTKEGGYTALRFNEARALWRDSTAILQAGDQGRTVPAVFRWLSVLVDEGYLDAHGERRIVGLGMASDKGKVEFFREDRFPLPLVYLRAADRQVLDLLTSAIQAAEKAAKVLWGAQRTAARALASPNADTGGTSEPRREDLDQLMAPWGAERRYWSQLDSRFWELLRALPAEREAALGLWIEFLRRAAFSAFDGVAESLGSTPRELKAYVLGSRQLAAGLAQELPQPQQSTVTPQTV
ncbi:MAG: type I-E CRISPR-associated protein Cse1/CasA [Caldilineaceae bacterium]